jgi:DNA-directed RNA polymerase specialized sigma24 family protein
MTPGGSITGWIQRLKAGDRAAAQPLWEAYFHRLVALARARLRACVRRAADEEDVALSAFGSFCRRAEQGQFPRLEDRDDLRKLLFVLTVRKAIDQARREGHEAQVRSLEDLADREAEQVLGRELTPALAAQVHDAYRQLLDQLGNETLRSIARLKLEGYTNAEIATRLGCVVPTVERKLQQIRRLWTREVGDESDHSGGR